MPTSLEHHAGHAHQRGELVLLHQQEGGLPLGDVGQLGRQTGKDRFPFVIEWRMDGANPGSFDAQLERLRGSLRRLVCRR